MSGIFSTFNTANKGLQATQIAIHTASHNVSNEKTPGYSRQRVDLKADLAFNLVGVGQLGTGVKMESIVRFVDEFVTKQIRQENGTFQKFSAKSEALEQIEIIFNEPSDVGLNFNLGEMFESWQELSKNPESLTSKTIVVEKSKTLADTFNHMSNQIDNLTESTKAVIVNTVGEFNSIVTQLDSLNKQIFNTAIRGQIPNDLLDQRDLMLKNLSSITNFEAEFDKYGRVSIEMGKGNVVLNKDTVNEMAVGNDQKITIGNVVNVDAEIKSGQIRGHLDGLKEISERKGELDTLAMTMAEAINKAHDPGLKIFKGTTAGNIEINDDISKDNSKIIAGDKADGPEGDGSRALAIAGIRNDKTLDFGNGNTTIEGAYSNIVTKVGISKEHSANMIANQEVLLDQLEMRRESTSGVNRNEEVSNLITFQKSFEANARVISVLTDMLDTLIRMGA